MVEDWIGPSGGDKTKNMQRIQLLRMVGGTTCLSLRGGNVIPSVQGMVVVVEEHWLFGQVAGGGYQSDQLQEAGGYSRRNASSIKGSQMDASSWMVSLNHGVRA
ncbi:hypothetical protein SLA2020_325280 [Shorea laevis]